MLAKFEKEETVKICEIRPLDLMLCSLRGETTEQGLVERYKEKYESGIELPPLDVQKDTYCLINGYHRYQALKELNKETVKVKVWNIDSQDLLYFGYALNDSQGQTIPTYYRNQLISRARYDDKKSLKEIGQIFGLTEPRISQILSSFATKEQLSEFSISNAKETKVDMRRKVDELEILDGIAKGVSQSEIAKMFGISEGRVSQVKKAHLSDEEKITVILNMTPSSLSDLFKTALGNGIFPSAHLKFSKHKIETRNSNQSCTTIAQYLLPSPNQKFIEKYDIVIDNFAGYIEESILKPIKDWDKFGLASVIFFKKGSEQKIMLFNESQLEKLIIQYPPIKPFNNELPYLEIENLNPDLSIEPELGKSFPIIGEKGKLDLEVKDEQLTLKFECKHGFECHRVIPIRSFINEKKGNVFASCRLEDLDRVSRLLIDPNVNNNFTLNFWKDRDDLLIKVKSNCYTKLMYLSYPKTDSK